MKSSRMANATMASPLRRTWAFLLWSISSGPVSTRTGSWVAKRRLCTRSRKESRADMLRSSRCAKQFLDLLDSIEKLGLRIGRNAYRRLERLVLLEEALRGSND